MDSYTPLRGRGARGAEREDCKRCYYPHSITGTLQIHVSSGGFVWSDIPLALPLPLQAGSCSAPSSPPSSHQAFQLASVLRSPFSVPPRPSPSQPWVSLPSLRDGGERGVGSWVLISALVWNEGCGRAGLARLPPLPHYCGAFGWSKGPGVLR